ncbi:HD domain-containing protein [Methanohalophilus profundi]|uniref:HD domain-containing protein n=1 Tax=Methanohalophilus profundi TaxID=2138083 RepID=UPI00101C6217|nr:HD domain-containing protein [Methanohalophilus profundi]
MVSSRAIHDPVHKTILLTPLQKELVETPQVQRLRSIQQLGLVDIVYPGAKHSRFEHSLGTMHMASLMADALSLPQEDKVKVEVAGLLHDVGHSAYSHAVEDVLKRNPDIKPQYGGIIRENHEAFSEYVIRNCFANNGNIARIVEDELGQDPVDFFDQIALMATGKTSFLEKPYLGQLISGDIDADRIDFLLRDSYHTGISLGLIDVDQIIQNLSIRNGNIVLGKKDGCSYDEDMTLTVAESMLIARAHHYNAIVHHPHTQSARIMLLRALENALAVFGEKKDAESVNNEAGLFFTQYNDADLIYFIKTYGSDQAQRLISSVLAGNICDPIVRFNQKTLNPATRMALSTITRHGVAKKMFEEQLEKRIGDVFVDLSVASGVPRSTRVVVNGEDSFFYDESALANGLVRAISRQLSLVVFSPVDGIGCPEAAQLKDVVGYTVDTLSPQLLRFIRQENYLPIEGLILLFYTVNSIFWKEEDGFVSIPRLRNITWIYRMVQRFSEDARLRNLFDYRFHRDYGFPYSNRVFEDIQLLVAMGIVDEDLRYYEKDNRFHQRYEYVLTMHGVKYGKQLSEAYGREFRELTKILRQDKHSIPRDIVTIPARRYQQP